MSVFATLQDIIAADGEVKRGTVDAYGGTVNLRSLSSAEMIDWIELQGVPEKAKFAGLYLLVMSIEGADGSRVAKEERDAVVEVFKNKHAASNRTVIRAARLLNGLDNANGTMDALKNVSGRTSTDASPTASASN